MKKWVIPGLIVVVLALLGWTAPLWAPPVLGFITDNTDLIQGLTDAVQLLLWIGAAIVGGVRVWQGRKDQAAALPGPSSSYSAQLSGSGAVAQGAGAVAAGERGMAIGTLHGNVVMGEPPKVQAEFSELRRTYLERLMNQSRDLSLAGIDPAATGTGRETRLKLDAVYTALLTQSTQIEENPRRHGLSTRVEGRRLSALAQLNEHKRLVLLGDPGSGKSTFVNFVALCLAGECLGSTEANLSLLTAPLPEDDPSFIYREREKEPQPQPWNHGPLLPVRVILRDLAARGLPEPGEKPKAHHLWKFIEKELSGAGLEEFAPHLKKELLERGGLVLLDGLDEVPEAEQRREQIRQIVEDFVRTFGRTCRVLLTSRTYAYHNQEWRLPGFAEAVLAPFTPGQIDRFVTYWYAHAASLGRFDAEGAAGRAELLKRAISNSQRLMELAERPLLLTLMASLHAWRGGTLPERREELYADAVELLLNIWSQQSVVLDGQGNPLLQQPSLAEWLKVDRKKVREVLDELAYGAHLAQPDLAGTADIEEGDLISALIRVSRNPEIHHAQLVEYLCHRAGLLVPRGVGVYTFPHRTFQEYLAACHLTGETYPTRVAELARKDPNRWREVALLAGAKAARGAAASVWYLADALCWREPGEAESDEEKVEDIWGAHLAGQAVAESADLERVSASNRPKLEKLQRWHLRLIREPGLPATERALAGKTLARLGDPRFDPDHWYLPKEPLLGFVEVPAGPFLMGSDKRDSGNEREGPLREMTLPTFFMGHYPVTVAQFRAFIEASNYSPATCESIDGLSNHPVVNVTWHDALAYCRWLGERLQEIAGRCLRDGTSEQRSFWEAVAQGRLRASLPSEAEWEKAARGPDGRIYPWGDQREPDLANYDRTQIGEPSTVGCFLGGASPYGCEDIAGNVWEWTRSLFEESPYPDEVEEQRKRDDLLATGPRVWRGGYYNGSLEYARCAYSRIRPDPSSRFWYAGFRVVLSPFT
jgi:formylglycine-generating enzyme required for sulfatase activity